MEKVRCRNCGEWFIRRSRTGEFRRRKTIDGRELRGWKMITCSSRCSKENIMNQRKIYAKARLKK